MLKNALLVTASLIAGAGGVQLLHAASGAPAYSIALIDIKDEAGYKAAVADVRKRIADHGGKFIITAGAAGGMGEMTSPTGDTVPSRLVVSEYANMDAANKWWKEVGEQDIKTLGQRATLHLYFVEGVTK